MILDYEVLKFIWWLLVGVLFIGFAVTDGMDMGVGTLLPFLSKKDEERRVIINTVGPHWDGNQVWLITAGGAIFAAWPAVYGAAFSGFYTAMLLVLFALFFRPVGFDYRSKIGDPSWRNAWDWGLFVGGAVPALIFGVAFGNLLQGVPFHLDDMLRAYYTGSFWGLLNPFALLAGVLSLAMLVTSVVLFRTGAQSASVSLIAASGGNFMLAVCLGVASASLGPMPDLGDYTRMTSMLAPWSAVLLGAGMAIHGVMRGIDELREPGKGRKIYGGVLCLLALVGTLMAYQMGRHAIGRLQESEQPPVSRQGVPGVQLG